MFYVNYNSVSNANVNIGCRVLLGLATHLHSRPRKYPMAGARTSSAPLGADEPSGHGLVPSPEQAPAGEGKTVRLKGGNILNTRKECEA